MDLEEELQWFEQNPGSQSANEQGYPHSQSFPASSGGSAHHASFNQQQQLQQQTRHTPTACPLQQQQYQVARQHQSATPLPAMRSRHPAFPSATQPNQSAVFHARPDLQAQSRYQNASSGHPQQSHFAQPITMNRQLQRTQSSARPEYVRSRDGSRFYIRTAGNVTEIDPVAHGMCFLMTS